MTNDRKIEIYESIMPEIRSALSACPDNVAGMATAACILHHAFPLFFWTGFYRVIAPKKLAIGPYQGTLGCLMIPFDKGVCGFSATTKETVIVDDVHKFEGHITCDSRSCSEIVVPVFDSKGELIGVLDIDSVEYSTFDTTDAKYLEQICQLISNIERDN
jgi:GAF domain-containing protein